MKYHKPVKEVGANQRDTMAHVEDVMTTGVLTATRHQSVADVKGLMSKHGIQSVPVVNEEREPIGVLTASDLIDGPAPETLVGKVMTPGVYTIPQYAGVHVAARMMRNHHIHHLIVTHEKQVVGIVSSFDLLKLVEDKRFAKKNPPSPRKHGLGRRRQDEEGSTG